jgi:hypothetical protein
LAKIGFILGLIGTILTCLVGLAYIGIIVFAVMTHGTMPQSTF